MPIINTGINSNSNITNNINHSAFNIEHQNSNLITSNHDNEENSQEEIELMIEEISDYQFSNHTESD
jgi:hypothetical protein